MLVSKIPFLDEVPYEIRKIFATMAEPLCNEQTFCREMVARAVLDALGLTNSVPLKKRQQIISEARAWLMGGPFTDVWFDFAGLPYHKVAKCVLAVKPIGGVVEPDN